MSIEEQIYEWFNNCETLEEKQEVINCINEIVGDLILNLEEQKEK